MDAVQEELAALALHLRNRRDAILQAWQGAIKRDPTITTGDALPRVQLLDHIPSMLANFEHALYRAPEDAVEAGTEAGQEPAVAHGLQRWRQGYDLREVTRELGKLNECVVAELDSYSVSNPEISHDRDRHRAARMGGTVQHGNRRERRAVLRAAAAGGNRSREGSRSRARGDPVAAEQQRGDLWRQAAHDLRGNLGVVATATVGLTHKGLRETSRDDFVRILMRNVTSLASSAR